MEENKNIETTSEAVDKADFADVNYGKEEEKETLEKREESKKSVKTGIFGIIIAAIAVVAIIAAFAIKFSGKDANGLGNRFSMVIGVPEGNVLYHTDFAGEKLYTSSFDEKTFGERKEVSAEIAPWGFTKYDGDIYYFDRIKNGIYKLSENGESQLISAGISYYHQFEGKYIYYMEPVGSYGGFVKRVPVTGGDAETVLNVYTSCFAVSGKYIVYYDASINDLLVTKLDDSIAFAKESGDEPKTSAELKAIVVAEERLAQNINVVGDDVFFQDGSKENVLCRASIKTGKVSEINFGTAGTHLNVYGDYMFYIGSDNCLYRMNLDGKDIRNLTGKAFSEFAGFGVFEDYIVAYALMPQLNSESMQTEYTPVIAMIDFEGTPKMVLPAIDESLSSMYEEAIPEITEEEMAETSEESVG